MEIREAIKNNPLQATTVGLAIIGVVFSIFNFYLLSQLAPIERRVVALEDFDKQNTPLIAEFITVKEKISNIEKIVARIENKVDRIEK